MPSRRLNKAVTFCGTGGNRRLSSLLGRRNVKYFQLLSIPLLVPPFDNQYDLLLSWPKLGLEVELSSSRKSYSRSSSSRLSSDSCTNVSPSSAAQSVTNTVAT